MLYFRVQAFGDVLAEHECDCDACILLRETKIGISVDVIIKAASRREAKARLLELCEAQLDERAPAHYDHDGLVPDDLLISIEEVAEDVVMRLHSAPALFGEDFVPDERIPF